MAYANGRTPLHMLVHLGGNHYLAPGINARWQWMVRTAREKYGVTLRITPSYGDWWGGWNGYRTYDAQVLYRRYLGAIAAQPGWSPHGRHGAIDVENWIALAGGGQSLLAWSRFTALCRAAGFVDSRVRGEAWHIECDADPWAIPAFTGTPAVIKPQTTKKPEPEILEEDAMFKPTVHVRTEGPFEATLAHPEIGSDLAPHTGPGTGGKTVSDDGKVTTYRGFMVTADGDIAKAWARTHARGSGQETSRTDRAGYIAIQVEASRLASQIGA